MKKDVSIDIMYELKQIKKILLGNGEPGLCEDHRAVKKDFYELKEELKDIIQIVKKQNSFFYFIKLVIANVFTILMIISPFLPDIIKFLLRK